MIFEILFNEIKNNISISIGVELNFEVRKFCHIDYQQKVPIQRIPCVI